MSNSNIGAIDTASVRIPPRLIVIPPPEPPFFGPLAATLFIGFGSVATVYGVLTLIFGEPQVKWVCLLCWSLGGLLVGTYLWMNGRYERGCREFMRNWEPRPFDSHAAEIQRLWRRPPKPPRPGQVQALLREPSMERAQVVSMGVLRVPEVGDSRFEPEIITNAQLLGVRLLFVPPALAIVAIWYLKVRGAIPCRLNIALLYFVGAGAVAGCMWIAKSVIRPTYIRMAPGVLQVLAYRFRKPPLVRDYPLDAGTVAVVRHELGWPTLTLMRGEQQDVVPLGFDPAWKARMERVWHALLSSAPAPTMNADELLG